MGERMRFGVLGCGVIGMTHAEAILQLPDAQLVAVADEVPEAARRLAQQHGVVACEGLQVLLDRDDLDVVNVCTPSGLHGEHACAIMRSGRHVIIEKPIEVRSEAIDEMLEVQDAAGVKLAVIFQHRFDAASQAVRALVEEAAFGRLVLGNAHVLWWRSQEYYDSGAWRGTWALDGGGVLMNQSIHSIDLLQWFMGPVRGIASYSGTLAHRMETEDTAVAVLRFESGAFGTIVGTTCAYPGVSTRIELFGEFGSAVIENDRLAFLHLARDDREPIPPYGLPHGTTGGAARSATPPAAGGVNTHAMQIDDAIRAIREDGTPLVDGSEARKAVEIIRGIYESAQTGKEVRLS